MTGIPQDPPFERAWGVLLGASLCMFCGTPAVIYYTFGVFLPEIVADTGWSAARVAAAIGPGALVVALMAPFVGMLTDRVGVRPMATVGGLAFGIGIALLGIGATGSAMFTVLTVVMYALAFAATPIVYAQAVTAWFDRRRGMALGVIFASGALGIAVWPAYSALLIREVGWRQAYVVMGATAGAVIFLAGLFLLKSPPTRIAAIAASAFRPGLSAGEAIRTGRFWKIAIVFAVLSAVLGGAAVQLPVILRQQGADAQAAASIMSVVGIAMLLGRLMLGVLLDRLFAVHLTIGMTLISMLAFITLLGASGPASLIAAAALLGFGLGSEYAVVAYIVSRAFGFRAYGAIYGLATFATSIGLAAGPAAFGVALVTGTSPDLIFAVAIALLAIPLLILLTLRRTDLPFGGVVPAVQPETASA